MNSEYFTSDEEIEKLTKEKGWDYISYLFNRLTESQIEKYKYNLDWLKISKYQKLSPEQIDKYSIYLHWYFISMYQKLTPKLIDKYADKVSWNWVSFYQDLTIDQLKQYENKLVIEYLFKNKYLKDKIKFSILYE